MFGAGNFGLGFNKALEQGRQNRAEAAELFDQYRKRNPNATAEEMWRYVESVSSGPDLYLRKALPTRQALQRMEQDAQREREREEMSQRITQASANLDLQDKFRRVLGERMLTEDDPEKAMADAIESFGYSDDPQFRSLAYRWVPNPRNFQEQKRSEYELGQQGRYAETVGDFMQRGLPVPEDQWQRLYAGQPQYVIDNAKKRYERDLNAREAENQRAMMKTRSEIVNNPAYVKLFALDPTGLEAQAVRERIRATIGQFTPEDQVDQYLNGIMAEIKERADTYNFTESFGQQQQAAQRISQQLMADAKLNAAQAGSIANFAVSGLGVEDEADRESIQTATTALVSDFFSRYLAAPTAASDIESEQLPYQIGEIAAQAIASSVDKDTGLVNLADARAKLLNALQSNKSIDVYSHRDAATLGRQRAQQEFPTPVTAAEFMAEKEAMIDGIVVTQEEALDKIDAAIADASGEDKRGKLNKKLYRLQQHQARIEREAIDIERLSKMPQAQRGTWQEGVADAALSKAKERIEALKLEMERTQQEIDAMPPVSYDVRGSRGQRQSSAIDSSQLPGKQKAFVGAIAPQAEAISRQTGIPAKLIIAQAALESGWGRSAAGNNLFGIKATGNWSGRSTTVPTKEFVNGRMVSTKDSFRAYDSPADSLRDHARLLTQNKRYRNVLNAETEEEAARALQEAGYATDPLYANKLISIMRQLG